MYGPRAELSKIPFITHPLEHEEQFNFHGIDIQVIAVPGHTLGHIVYFIDAIDVLFCGDTLFAMGCGRVLKERLNRCIIHCLVWLPCRRAQVYCTHEYTLSNAQFAKHVEPDNPEILERFEQIERLRMLGQCTLPSSIEIELQTNPFLRAESVEEFQRLRTLRMNFKFNTKLKINL